MGGVVVDRYFPGSSATGVSVVAGERYLRRALDEDDDPSALTAGSRAVYERVTAEDPREVRQLVGELPPHGRRVLDGLSPVAVADRIAAPVLAAHAVDDPAVPYAELLRLDGALPGATTMTVESFRHVDLSLSGDVSTLVSGLVTAWQLVAGVLRPQERWPWESEG